MIKTTVKTILKSFNISINRLPSKQQTQRIMEAKRIYEAEIKDREQKRIKWLRDLNIKTILDIGANTGQFAEHIYQIFPDARIYSFEPLQECYLELLRKFDDKNLFQAFNVALGEEQGEIMINRNDFSPSSSLLPMADLHKDSFEHTKNTIEQKVKINKLDNLVNNLIIEKPLLIKIDVQGFEDKVIRGGINTIQDATVVICELSTEELYKDQPLFQDIYQLLYSVGFRYKGNYDQLLSPLDGRILQVDGIFIKNV